MEQIRKIQVLLFILITVSSFSQIKVDADIRPRFEYRHGFNNLFPDNADPAAFVVQRTRLNLHYKMDKLTFMMSFQDVSTWGDTRQIDPTDSNNSFSLFQSWIQYSFDENWSTKLGRQVISYDNERIFGGLDWAMQGRFHDAALFKYKKENFITDIGFAFSQESQRNTGTDFSLQGAFTYKAMQYVYLKKKWEKNSFSFLFLNTGFQKFTGTNNDIADGVFYRQTTGSYFTFPLNKLKFMGSAYYQFGKATATTDLSAYELSLEANYKPGKTLLGLGFEFLSGTDQTGATKNNSFFPLYGTNHKFNGYMDYFYVGNHANNVGLNDFYAKAVFKTGEKSTLLTKVHYFASNATLNNNADSYLGTEIDLVFTQKIIKSITMKIGYSQMFASESMSLIKGGVTNDNTNNWGWMMLVIKPSLFDSSKKQLIKDKTMELIKKKTVADFVTENIKTAHIFKKHGIDFCCGGGITIEKACAKNNVDQKTLEKQLSEVGVVDDVIEDYNKWSLDFLMIYIENIHHTYIRENLPLISQYVTKVAKVHGHHCPEVVEVNRLFHETANELLLHLQKEEQILFPFIKQLLKIEKEKDTQKIPLPFGTVNNPIKMMEHEHEDVGDVFKEISRLANNYQPPEGACNTFRALYSKLEEFEQDLHKHIHLENNILHPKAIALEKEMN